MSFLFAFFESIWRRCFGCGNFNRFILHIINIVSTSFFLWYLDISWIRIAFVVPIYEFLYWSRAHGEFFDFGHSNPPNVSRYEQFWWWKYVKKIIPQSEWYDFCCDFICMSIRYTLPALLASIGLLSIPFAFSGILLSCGYALMWKFYDWGYIKNPTEYAEFIAGFVSGLFLTFC